MQKKLIFLFFCIWLIGQSYAFGQSLERLKFASWNIRWQSDGDVEQGNAWKKRFEPIANVIRFYDFDIIAIQEGSQSKLNDIAPLLEDYDIIETEETKHNPILIKKGNLKLLDKGRFYLSKTPKKKSKSWDSKHARYCVWVKLQKDDIIFFVFNTHFDYHGKEAQSESAKMMNLFIPAISNNATYIIAGDFNAAEGSNPYNILVSTQNIQDARHVADFVHVTKQSYNYFDPQKYSKWDLDHIFTSQDIRIHRYGVLNETYYDGETFRYPSDHSPIMAIMELPSTK